MKKRYVFFLLPVLGMLLSAPAYAERAITVSFSRAMLTITDSEREILLETPVVLPKANFYDLPVTGTVARAEMGPSWKPTPTMHRTKPGKYKEYYAPYENGNAMGHCKVSIRFNGTSSALQHVRIHGNAKEKDLQQKRSAGCIRILDDVCPILVALTSRVTPARVTFEH
jgi:lipoprotein-anchoring transpeptidase ErfK/SrfK